MNEKNAKKPHYVNSKLFKQQLIEYYETGANLEELGVHLMNIAEGLSYKVNFIRYSKSWKDEMSNQGQFAVEPIGKLRTILNSHGLVRDRVEVEFNGVPGEESIVINNKAEIRDYIGEVRITWNEDIKSGNVIAAADEIRKNPNRNLLIHDLKYSD